MTTYTYHLAKDYEVKRAYGHRLTCPQCGKPKCFVPYVDAWGEPISTEVGKCDHQNSCGYHYTPSEWRRDHPNTTDILSKPVTIRPLKPIRQRSCINADVYTRTWLPDYHGNTLAAFLLNVFPQAAVEWCINEYRFGTSKNGSCVFWQFDRHWKCRGGKVMEYDPATGKRVKKDGNGRVSWAHTLLGLTDYNLEQCLYGEHLIDEYPNVPVLVVESEKTALICSMLLPGNGHNYLTVATGGAGGLSRQRMEALRGRDVVLMPDNGMYAEWYDKALTMLTMFRTLRISQLMEVGAYDINPGDDIGDLLLQHVDDGHIQLMDLHLVGVGGGRPTG